MNSSKIYNFRQARSQYGPIEQHVCELQGNNLNVVFVNNKNLNLIKSSIDDRKSAYAQWPEIKSMKSSEPIHSYPKDHVIFRPRAGWAPRNSLSVYWNDLRLYSQYETDVVETHGWFDHKDIPNLRIVLYLLHAIKERWHQIQNLTKGS